MLQDSTLIMETACSSETLVSIFKTIWCHSPEDYNLNSHYLEIYSFKCISYQSDYHFGTLHQEWDRKINEELYSGVYYCYFRVDNVVNHSVIRWNPISTPCSNNMVCCFVSTEVQSFCMRSLCVTAIQMHWWSVDVCRGECRNKIKF